MTTILSRLWQRLCDHWNGPKWRFRYHNAEAQVRALQYRLGLAQIEAHCLAATVAARSRKLNRQKKGHQ